MSAAGGSEFSTGQPTVLLVEDDDMLRRMLARALTSAGFYVAEAQNGAIALQVAQELQNRVVLVLTDITMPVMNGFQLARVFESLYPSIPILFMSGAMPRASQDIPLLAVGTRLLLKPFTSDVLLEAITATIDHDRHSAQRTSA